MEYLGSHWTHLREILYVYMSLKSVDHIEAGIRSDMSYYFILLVWEPPEVIKCFRPKLLLACRCSIGPNALPDPIFIVSIYVFIHTTRHPTATIFIPHCNLYSLCGASAHFRFVASTLPASLDNWTSERWECRLQNLPSSAATWFSPSGTYFIFKLVFSSHNAVQIIKTRGQPLVSKTWKCIVEQGIAFHLHHGLLQYQSLLRRDTWTDVKSCVLHGLCDTSAPWCTPQIN